MTYRIGEAEPAVGDGTPCHEAAEAQARTLCVVRSMRGLSFALR